MKAILVAALSLWTFAASAHAKLRVVTTTEDMAALAREVGGDLNDVRSIAKGYQDPHFVEAKPSYLLLLKRADLFIQVGLELESGWVPALLTNARNPKILPGGPGFLDASDGCDVLQKPAGTVDRSQGDVHPLGNPHYWLDPDNGRTIVRSIARRLSALDPEHAKAYEEKLAGFEARLAEKEKEWETLAASFKGAKVVTYHNSWPNFARRFGLQVADYVEPKPGIPPSPAHVRSLIARMRSEGIRLILMEPYFDDKLPRKIAAEAGAKLLVFPPSVGGDESVKTYFELFDRDLAALKEAASTGPQP